MSLTRRSEMRGCLKYKTCSISMTESKEDFYPEKCLLSQALLQHQIQTPLWPGSENTSYDIRYIFNLLVNNVI